jgi:hypothetical protein
MPDNIQSNSDTQPVGTQVPNEPWFAPGQRSLERIANYSERQREKDAPMFVDFSNAKNTISFHTRLRIIEIIFSCSTAGDHVTVAFGGRVFDFLLAVGCTPVPFPYEADMGIDITFTNVTSADHATYAYIVAYTE